MICIDASVVGKLICPDERAEEAIQQYEQSRIAGERFISPTLLPFEVASILRKKRLRKLLSPPEILTAIHSFHGLKIQLIDFEELMERSLTLSELLGSSLTPYDASYLAVAEKQKASLWTADAVFYETVSSILPNVQFIES